MVWETKQTPLKKVYKANPDTLKKTVGSRLKRLRKSYGYAQGELAELLGISPQALNSYENGRRMPAMDYLVFLADSFDCSLDWLLGREGEVKPGCLGEPLTSVSEAEIQYTQNLIGQLATSLQHTENHLDMLQRYVKTLGIDRHPA